MFISPTRKPVPSFFTVSFTEIQAMFETIETVI
jgi:hypothetical protein